VVLRALKLGDFLTAVPALRALRRAFPGHELALATPAWLAPLVHHTGVVHRVADTAELAPLDRSLHGSDVAVNLHGRGPQSTALLAATAPGRLISYGVEGGALWREDEHERERWCRLLREEGIPADAGDLRVAPPPVDPPSAAVGATIVHPGASKPSRCWPPHRWAEVVRAELGAGRRVVVTGVERERPLAADVARRAGLGAARVLAGRTGLLELFALVAAAGRVVCGDTGIAHVASATGTPSVVLFGPTSPATWGPPAGGAHVALWAGRTGDPLAATPDAGLLAISVGQVADALASLTPAAVSC
jgi:ADP-heptose:LPS heptosyltransferase